MAVFDDTRFFRWYCLAGVMGVGGIVYLGKIGFWERLDNWWEMNPWADSGLIIGFCILAIVLTLMAKEAK